MLAAALLALCLAITPGHATANAPVPTEADRAAAERVARMGADSPPERLVQQLDALKLSEGGLFVLGGLEPVLVEQVINPKSRQVLEYVATLPGTTQSELRSGETVVRTTAIWSKRERAYLEDIADTWGLKKHKKLKYMRIGNLSGRSMRFELVGKKDEMSIELALGDLPVRQEKALKKLTAHFGAQPPPITSGPGSRLPLVDGSFEKDTSLSTTWRVEKAIELGGPLPAAEVSLDRNEVLDGSASLRINSDASTRHWDMVTQVVPVPGGTPVILRGNVKARRVVRERDQDRRFFMGLQFLDGAGSVVGENILPIDSGDMDWRDYALHARAPDGATAARLVLVCTMSGTVWFDGLTLEVGY